MFQAQEDEKSLYHNEWSTDLSMDQPSYGSVLLQIQEANVEADGSCDFVRKTCDIITSTSKYIDRTKPVTLTYWESLNLWSKRTTIGSCAGLFINV